MLQKGAAKKVTIYVNEEARYHAGPLYQAILTFLLHRQVAGATATRGMAGFGAHRVIHTPKVEALGEHLPVRVEFVESAARVEEILPALYDMVGDGLIEVQDTTIVKAAAQERQAEPAPAAHGEKRGSARLMRIYLGEADRWEGEPLYDAIVKRLRMLDVAGATVYRGILGYGAKRHTHKEGRLHLSRDLPIMISVVDSAEKLDAVLPEIEAMLGDALIVFSDVEMIRLVRAVPGGEQPHEGT